VTLTLLVSDEAIASEEVSTSVELSAEIQERVVGRDITNVSTLFAALIQELGIAADSLTARFLWELINDSQTVTWQNIASSSPTAWQTINDADDPNWTPVNASML
jgi:hypothetical protein